MKNDNPDKYRSNEELIRAAAAEGMDADRFGQKLAKFRSRKHDRRSRWHIDFDPIPKSAQTRDEKAHLLEVREVLWDNTLSAVRHFTKDAQFVRLGETVDATFSFPQELLDTLSFCIATARLGEWSLHFSEKMQGWVERDGKRESFVELIENRKALFDGEKYQFALLRGDLAAFEFGTVTYCLQFVESETVPTRPFHRRLDLGFMSPLSLFLMGYMVFILYLHSLPAPEVGDILDAPDRFRSIIVPQLVEEESPLPIEEKKKDSLFEESSSPDKSIGEEGKVGDEKAKVDKAQGSVRRAIDEKVAHSAGILGALDSGLESMDKLFGGGALGAGLEKTLGMIEGIAGLDMRGTGGLGIRGAGFGGGGTALSIGGLGTWGRGNPNGDARYGFDAAKKLKKNTAMTNITSGPSGIIGSLDKSLIQRIIKKHLSQLRYCYQKELNKNPRLYGKVSVRFTIAPTGNVSSSQVKTTTIKNALVESCVTNVIRRIVFPQPRNGGIVVVTYPFIFNRTGA